MSSIYAVELENINKAFANVLAVNDATIRVRQGTIHCIVGENGAGKTTLVNILYGMLKPDSGTIKINDHPVVIHSPARAIELGLGCVHQELMLAPSLTITENIIAGRLPQNGYFYSQCSAGKYITQLAQACGFELDPSAKIQNLSIGQMQAVEILKVLYRGANVIILDEPTAVLTPGEVKRLFVTLRKLKQEGKTIILITHKLDEVMEIADWVSVLRQGRVMGNYAIEEVLIPKLVEAMVGRNIDLNIDKREGTRGAEILKIEELEVKNDQGASVVNELCLSLHANEILGIAGVEGNGQVELVEALIGLRRAVNGRISYQGEDIVDLTPRQRRESGIAFIPENRLRHGTSIRCSIQDNITSLVYYKPPFSKLGVLNSNALREYSRDLIQKYNIRTAGPMEPVRSLSGGNIQRVIIAREFSSHPKVLIASQPTRGLDIASTKYIHNQLIQSRVNGLAVLIISADLNEILDISDRILVIYKGRIVKEFSCREANKDQIGSAMTGGLS